MASGKRRRTSVASSPRALKRFRRDFRWDGVALQPYKSRTDNAGEFAGASRQVIAGDRGEPIAFELRYFELAPGGFTSLERHRHCHVVIGLRGRGEVTIGARQHRVAPFDAIYIAPNRVHRLRAIGRESFGFFCIVNRERDKPRRIVTRTTRPRRFVTGSSKLQR